MSREATAFEIFRGGVSPVETVLGESHTSGPECVDSMFSRSRIKRRGQREKVASSNRMPGFRIRACSALVKFEIKRSGISFLLPLLFEEGLPFLNSFKITSFVSRERNFFSKFQEGSILQLKRFLARLPVSRAEQPNQHFSNRAPTGSCKRELGIIRNPPPRIRIRVDSSRFLWAVLSM